MHIQRRTSYTGSIERWTQASRGRKWGRSRGIFFNSFLRASRMGGPSAREAERMDCFYIRPMAVRPGRRGSIPMDIMGSPLFRFAMERMVLSVVRTYYAPPTEARLGQSMIRPSEYLHRA